MNDDMTPAASAVAGDGGSDTGLAAAPRPSTAGGLIRAAREAQAIDLASLAAMLKIPLRRLDALEQGRHEELQGPTFERALAQAACRVLRVDPKPVLELLPRHELNTLERVTEGINTPFRERQGGLGRGLGDMTPTFRPAVVFPLLLIVAAVALWYVPAGLWARVTEPLMASLSSVTSTNAPAAGSSANASINSSVNPSVNPSANPTGAVAGASADAASGTLPAAATGAVVADRNPDEASTAKGTVPGRSPEGASDAAGVAAAAVPAAGAVDEVLAHSEATPTIPLQVFATADSWVEVLDAQGHPLLSRTVVAGESVGLDGALPMRLKIGNAGGTRIMLRGDNVDLAPWTRDNVARLELK